MLKLRHTCIERVPLALLLLTSMLVATACNPFKSDDAPSPVTTTDMLTGLLAQNGSIMFTFTVTTAGSVGVTLTSVTPATSSAIGLGIGTSSDGITCSVTNSTSAAVAGSTAQLTTTENAGTHCVKVYDVGNLTAASTVAISVAHS